MTALVWFRQDLRVWDHSALYAACAEHEQVMAFYAITPKQWKQHDTSPRQADFIARKLKVLEKDLAALNIPLWIEDCDDFDGSLAQLNELITRFGVTEVYAHREVEWNEQQRDAAFTQQAQALGVSLHWLDDLCVLPPGSVRTQNDEPFKVFTPFRKRWLALLNEEIPTPQPAPTRRQALDIQPPEWTVNYTRWDSSAWPVEEAEIRRSLRDYCHERVQDYKAKRDFPAIDGTSNLSAHLATGMLSPRQCLARLFEAAGHSMFDGQSGAFTWLNELVWREFYKHLMVAFPQLCKHRAFLPYTEEIVWDNHREVFHAWCNGKTGYPIVDAAMRQLNKTGWMHNRLRMIAASFLVKDCLVDWRWGEQYFMQQLIDGDLAANNGGWQWAASTGTDAQPYFRIFNPITQGERFDPDGQFTDAWVPELRDVPVKFKQKPWEWAQKNGALLAYPKPVVDHAKQRLRAIEVFETAKRGVA